MSTNQDLQKIKTRLIERKDELEERLRRLSTEKVSDDHVQDPGDQALTSTMEDLRSSLQDTEWQEYKRIRQALQKIEEGTYGVCIDCGGDITEKRLKSYPNAARCLACQEAFEDKS